MLSDCRVIALRTSPLPWILLLLAAGGCAPAAFLITPVPADRRLQEEPVLSESFWASKKIAIVDLDGLIVNARQASITGVPGENPVSLFKEKLDKAEADPAVRAIVVRINSPGGAVTASDMIYSELRSFRARTNKPVVASMLDVAASGGYYVACAADRIFAMPSTITGSIGVIMIAPDFSGTMDKLGIRANTIKSGEMKDAGSPLREMTPAEREYFQGLINRMYDSFVEVVSRSRSGCTREDIRALADGRVYLGQDARDKGLVDEVGDVYAALRAAKELAGLREQRVRVVQYARPLGYRPNVYAEAPPAALTQYNLLNINLPQGLAGPAPQFLYLWAPGL